MAQIHAQALGRVGPLTVFLMLCATSIIWSLDPAQSSRRLVGLIFCMLIGLLLAFRFEPQRFLHLLSWVLLFTALASLVVVLVMPEVGRDAHGDWIGVFNHKNRLGVMMGLGLVVWFIKLIQKLGNPLGSVGALGMIGLMLVMSDAMTSILTGMIVIVLILSMPALQRSGTALIGALLILTSLLLPLLAFAVVYFLDVMIGILGRDVTFAARTIIWKTVTQHLRDRPFLGYGYEAYWQGKSGMSSEVVRAMGGFVPYSAHNGYLDIALAVGFPGLVIFLFLIGMNLDRALLYLRSARSTGAMTILAVLTFLLIFNTVESSFIEYNGIGWILFCLHHSDSGKRDASASAIYRRRWLRDYPSPYWEKHRSPCAK